MEVVIGNGVAAVLAAVVAIVGAAVLWAARGRSWRWRWACVICPMLAAAAVALAVSEPVLRWSPGARRVVVLVDLSASTRESPWREPGWVRREAERRLGGKMRLTVVGFAREARVMLADVTAGEAGGWPVEWPGVEGMGAGSDVGAALGWRSEEEVRGGAVAPRWLITDGLVEAGAETRCVPFNLGVMEVGVRAVDVGVAEMVVKGAASGGTAGGGEMELWVRVRATGAAAVMVDLDRDGERLVRQPVDFAGAAERWISVRMKDVRGDRATRLVARVVGRGAAGAATMAGTGGGASGGRVDAWPENDEGTLLYLPGGPARVLVVGEDAGALAAAMNGAGLRARGVRISELPEDAGELVAAGWQVVVLEDVAMRAAEGAEGVEVLSAGTARGLEGFVERTGGGLVLVGGRYAFGPGYYPDGEGILEKLSPLASQPPERPGARVGFLLDASASMNEAAGAGAGGGAGERKFSLVARGVESALELLQGRDEITVIRFDGDAEVVASGLKREVGKEFGEKLRAVRPGGTTVPDGALPLVERVLGERAGGATTRAGAEGMTMVVLLTDGEIPKMDLGRWREVLGKAGAMLTVVAPRAVAGGENVLPELVKENRATWLALDGGADWVVMLRRAVAERLMGKARVERLDWKEIAGSSEFGVQNSEVTGATTAVAPAALLAGTSSRWIEVYLKPGASLRARGESGGWALAGVGRRGLGRVGAMAMEADGAAAREFVGRLAREVAGEAGDRRFVVTARREGDGWMVRAEGHDERGFLDGMGMRARVLMGTGEERVVEMAQVGPGEYEGRAGAAGAMVAVVERGGAGSGEELVGIVRGADVQTGEYPASVEGTSLPGGAVMLAAGGGERWMPGMMGWKVGLGAGLWVLAAGLGLGALWVRRGH